MPTLCKQAKHEWISVIYLFHSDFCFIQYFIIFFTNTFATLGTIKLLYVYLFPLRVLRFFSMGTIIGINLKFWQKLLYYLMMSWETDMVKKDVMVSHREKSILSKMKWFVLVHPLQLQNFHFKWFWTWPSAEHQHTTWNLLG